MPRQFSFRRKGRLLFSMSFGFLICSNISGQTSSKPWSIPPDARNVKNPVISNTGSIKDGKTLYVSYCTPCHGDKGKGDGPAAASLNPKPADHTSTALLAETDGSLFYKISEGRIPMPSYKAALTESQRWELINYIRTLNKKTTTK